MTIAFHDADGGSFPNLVLMKLAAWYRACGDDLEWFNPLKVEQYDRIYSSRVFTFTDDDGYLPETAIKGGTGYISKAVLPDFIEHICPDYSIYPKLNHSLGFVTRGCNRSCKWCVVPLKEGAIRAHADVDEFTRHRDLVLMDNNILAHDHGIDQLAKIARLNLRIDINQGLDARLIDDQIAQRLGRVKWIRHIRLACDDSSQTPAVKRAVELLRWHNANPARIACYVLIQDVDDALERIRFLKGLYVEPFAQPYRDELGTPATPEQTALARWCNHKALYKSSTWEQYRADQSKRANHSPMTHISQNSPQLSIF
ncbi:MAG: radical SAM protein [Magnetococcales bacterium]|nr:radical SAM protein [Magnetococcales bacterium]